MLCCAARNFFKLCRYHRTFAILSVLSLAVTALSFTVLVEKGLYTYQQSLEQEYLYVKSEDSNDLVSLYQEITNCEDLPSILSISLFDEQYTGIEYDTDQFQLYTAYGRLFTKEEMQQGAQVALLSIEYVRNLPKDKINTIWQDGIDVADGHCTAVGGYTDLARYFSVEELATDTPVPTLVTLPLKTYLSLGCQPTMLNCHFSSLLTSQQISTLEQLMVSHTGIEQYNIPGTNHTGIGSFVESLSIYTAILLMSMAAVTLIVSYWFRSESKRYLVYLTCGAKKRHIVLFSTVNMLLLNIIADVVAAALLALVNLHFTGVMLSILPAAWYAWVGVGLLAFCWVAVMLRSVPLMLRYRRVSGVEGA
jgi:hypothetical protein